MKKILLAALAASLMATSAMAFLGTVERVEVNSDGSMFIYVKNTSEGNLVKAAIPEEPEVRKAMLAASMTAYSTSSTVNAKKAGTDWKTITLWK